MNNLRRRLFTQEEVMRLGVDVADVSIGTTIKGLWMPINILNGDSGVLFLLSFDISAYADYLLSSLRLLYNNKNGNSYLPTAAVFNNTLYVSYNTITTNLTISISNNKYVLFGIYSPIAPGNGSSGDGYGGLPIHANILSLYFLNSMFYGDDNTYYVYLNFEPLCLLSSVSGSTPTPTTVTLKTKPSESKQIYCVTA